MKKPRHRAGFCLPDSPILAGFAMSLLIPERKLNDCYEAFIFMLICKM